MNKVIGWLLGVHEHESTLNIQIVMAELDDAIHELTEAVRDVREDVDYLIEFLGIDD
jgi:hypothetical protein